MGLSPAKIIIGSALVLFTVIGSVALFKKGEKTGEETVQEIVIESPVTSVEAPKEVLPIEKKEEKSEPLSLEISDVNLIDRLFTLDSSKLPIVETVSYTSRVPWLKGRPAWIADYATYYSTSRHFIARSLNHKPDYFTQKVSPGDKFNVLKKDKDIQFYLVIDLSLCKMWFYYYDVGSAERVLLKTYNVGLGRKESAKASGFLTPIGKYELGSRIAVYKPGIMGYLQEKKIEMMRVFGTRWIPFEKEVAGCSESPKGYGIHGSPWLNNSKGELVEDRDHISKYDSDGCIRLNSEDMEELFSIIITKPTTIELVKDFRDATPPGIEKRIN